MKPDYRREKDGLGISHSVTHRCSLDTAHVHRIRRARQKGRMKLGGWGRGEGQGAGSSLREQEEKKYKRTEIVEKMKIKWNRFYRERRKEKKRTGTEFEQMSQRKDKNTFCGVSQAPPGVCNHSGKARQ